MNHKEAREIIRSAFQRVHGRAPSALESTYVQAIAWLENKYGRAGQFGVFAGDGDYNWGSMHARARPPCPPGTREGEDLGNVCFRVFPSDVDAAAAFLYVLTRQSAAAQATLRAMDGSPEDVAEAMFDAGYYQGYPNRTRTQKIEEYARGIRNGIDAVASGVPVPSIPGRSPMGRLLLIAALGAGWWYVHEHGWPPALSAAGQGLSRRFHRLTR